MNLRNLERVLAREEEVKKKAVVHKAVYNGPQIRFTSRDGKFSFQKFSSLVISQWYRSHFCCLILIVVLSCRV